MTKEAPKQSEPIPNPVGDWQPANVHPTAGWAHDWRNPDATFEPDDDCVDAELARNDPTRRDNR